jgi:alpha-beta hydrolase superfamily lysophospholipase
MKKTRKVLIGLALTVTIGAVVFISGPRFELKTELRPVHLTEDLDTYLAQSESRFTDIVPGTEKTIVWADSSTQQKTAYALVMIHGYSATRQELAPMGDILAQKSGSNLFYTRLHGHGRNSEAMGNARADEWINDVAEAIAIGQRLGDNVILIGNSTGATLAVWAALQPEFRESIAGLVLISPNFYPANPMVAVTRWPWGLQIGKAIMGDYREWEPRNEMERRYWTYRYRIEVMFSMMALVDLVEGLDLNELRIPVLVIHSDRDQVVSVKKLIARYQEIGSTNKRRVTVNDTEDEWGHILAGDAISPSTTDFVVDQIMGFFSLGP